MSIQEVISELNRIQSEGLISAYAVGGAVAAVAYIETGSTEDIDVFVIFAGEQAKTLAPLILVWANLQLHGAIPQGERLVIGDWPVQFLPPGTPLYDEAIAGSQFLDFGGVEGRIMTAVHLAAIALATGRSKDYARVDEFIRRGKIDMDELMTLIARHGLDERWKTFQLRYPSQND